MNTTTEAGKGLTEAVKGISPFQSEAAEIEQWLKAKGQQYPNQFAMKALYACITNDDPFSHTEVYQRFIDDLRQLFLHPSVAATFHEISPTTTKGLHLYLRNLEHLFMALQRPVIAAELDRTGLKEFPDRYQNDEDWGGVEGLMRPYRAAE